MHSAFLFHAINNGTHDIEFVNAEMIDVYEEIDSELLEKVENVLLDKHPDATEELIEFAQTVQGPSKQKKGDDLSWRENSVGVLKLAILLLMVSINLLKKTQLKHLKSTRNSTQCY